MKTLGKMIKKEKEKKTQENEQQNPASNRKSIEKGMHRIKDQSFINKKMHKNYKDYDRNNNACTKK